VEDLKAYSILGFKTNTSDVPKESNRKKGNSEEGKKWKINTDG